ncbi:MAG: type II secretion system F family protein, partial [Usitatibacter sp.]
MAAVAKKAGQDVKQYNFTWTGKDKAGKVIKGETRAGGESIVTANLRRQGIQVQTIKKVRLKGGKKITEKDITIFTRQLAVMMKAGVPLLQAFDIVGRGHNNPSVGKLLLDIKTDVETGSSLGQAFRKYPRYFDALFCNLVAAGEQAGILDNLLDRLATYKEKILAIKGKIKSALFYPISIIVVALVVTAVIMIFVIPVFKDLFKSFGADLPGPTLVVMAISDWFLASWWWLFPGLFGGVWFFFYMWRRSLTMQRVIDRLVLKMPVFGDVIRKASIARWCRTLATMFAAGVPLVESLDSVAGAAGNYVYYDATKKIQNDVSTGTGLTISMGNTGAFPSMVLQMVAIGEESGALDSMLSKVADFYEQEVDEAVDSLSSLMEPMIMVVLGVLIGG